MVKRHKKLVVILLALAMVLSLAACGEKAPQQSQETPSSTQESSASVSTKPEPESTGTEESTEGKETAKITGTFPGEANGFGGKLLLEVQLKDGKIEKIDVKSNYETEGVGRVALHKVAERIVEGQSTKVEALTGATISSRAMMSGVEDALKKAKAPEGAFAKEYKIERKLEKALEADVVIVGGGGSGLAAAVTAAEKGASVIVLEKNGFVGGNTILCGGIYNAPDPELQGKQGIEDSPELFMKQTLEGGDNVGNPELVKVLTHNALDGLNWLRGLGMKFDETIIQGAGSLYPRTHQSIEPLGTGFIAAYLRKFEGNDKVQVLTETTVEELVMDGDKVAGVKAKNYDGSDLTVTAKKGVIIATGGFSKNIDMVLEYNTSGKWPNLTKDVVSTNLASIQGDGIRMAKKIGADLVDMEQMQFLYLGIPKLGMISGLVDLGAENTIFINQKGERFVQEDGRRDVICKAIFEQENGQMYYMHSSDTLDFNTEKSLEGVPMPELLKDHTYGWQSGETLEELAKNLNVPVEALKQTVESYNRAVDEKKDEFGRTLLTKKMEKGPYAAVPRVPALHHTMGGLRIDTQARVLNAQGQPIPGLYAAGEVTGGIHGANRLGGNAVVDTVVFGRLAGESAALGK